MSILGHQTAGKLAHVDIAVAAGICCIGTGVILEALGGSVGLGIPHLGLGIELCLILHQTAVGRHVGEEYEGQTTREEARTATDFEALVAEHVVGEAHAR